MVTRINAVRARLVAVPNLAVWVGLAVSAVGIVFIAIAWGGAAGQTEDFRALPYLASAGFPGVGLVVVGGLVVALHAQATASSARRAQLDELRAVLGHDPHEASVVNWRDPGLALFAALIVAGFVAFGVAWRVTAPTVHTTTQVAALASGGGGGLALILLGAALFYVQTGRRLAAREHADFERLLEGVDASK